jgi:transposase
MNFDTINPEVYQALPESVRAYICHLEATVQEQKAQIQTLNDRVADLEARLAKNSSNSSKPPSSDGLSRKPKSQRIQSGKKQGGQIGHVGKGLLQVENPDNIVNHTPLNCHNCGFNLIGVPGTCIERRQAFEIPKPKIEVTEHRIEEKLCPDCGHCTKGEFPDNIRGPVQYGERVQALVAYLSNQHFIPSDRICEICKDIFNISISPGTCVNINERLFTQLDIFESSLKAYLLAANVLHFDETGARCKKKLHWIHVTSSQMATLYIIHSKRGKEAMDEANILPQFKGIAIHDHWFPYFAYPQVLHGLCNSHHLRELTFIHEEKKEKWAKQMKDLLIFAKQEVEKYLEQGCLPNEVLQQIERTYQQIIDDGFVYHSQLPPLPQSKRGRVKQREGKNLLDRLKEKQDCVLKFLYDFSVPFTNNQGEQDIRMVKLKQKISGCFRAFTGGQIFCRIRSYISTAKKQNWNIWDVLTEAVKGIPRLLSI